MDSTSMIVALRNSPDAATSAGSHQLLAQAHRFAALLQPPQSTTPSQATNQSAGSLASVEAGDRYTDEVAPVQGGSRPVTLPTDVLKFGQGISDEMRAVQVRFDSSTRKITDPYLLEVSEGIKAAVQFQDMSARLRTTMKAVELSSQGFSQLFKMQG
jgi:hypothetical protein